MWILNGNEIQPPDNKQIIEDQIEVYHKTMTGKNSRDVIGTSKKHISCHWNEISAAELAKIYGPWHDQSVNASSYLLQITDLSFSLDVIIRADQTTYALPRNYNYSDINFTFIER